MPSLTTKLATSTTRMFGVIAVTGGVAFLASAVAIGAPAGRTAAIFAKCAAVVTSRPLPRTGGALPLSFALIGLVLLASARFSCSSRVVARRPSSWWQP